MLAAVAGGAGRSPALCFFRRHEAELGGSGRSRDPGPAGRSRRPSMIPWALIDIGQIPGGAPRRRRAAPGMRRGAEFSIMFGQIELMNSRFSGYGEALATIARERIPARRMRSAAAPVDRRPGHGLLRCAPRSPCSARMARIDVAELVPSVVAWARGLLGRGVRRQPGRPARQPPPGGCRSPDLPRPARPTTRSCSTSTTAPKA